MPAITFFALSATLLLTFFGSGDCGRLDDDFRRLEEIVDQLEAIHEAERNEQLKDPQARVISIKFTEFKKNYNKNYESHVEEQSAESTFADNYQKISQHNRLYAKGEVTFKLDHNQFSDMTNDQFAATMNGRRRKPAAGGLSRSAKNLDPHRFSTRTILPAAIDYRTKGWVTPVKNQGYCGSCWTFSATGALEGHWFNKTKKLVSLSEQNLVDCCTTGGNSGCSGGNEQEAFNCIKSSKGVDTEVSYPYLAENGACHFSNRTIGATDVGYEVLPAGDEQALMNAVATIGPISVAIDAGLNSFQFYDSGIYQDPNCTTNLDHAVLIVGYGYDGTLNQPYWIVKNSYGTDWGINGYINILRGVNQCGIAQAASYPRV